MRLIYGLCAVLALVASTAHAHPVAYKGSIGMMTEYAHDRTDIMANYTVTPRMAVGTDYSRIRYRSDEAYFGIVRINRLLFRDNRPDSQGNVHAYAGGGVREYSGDKDGAVFFGGEADWESRKHYISFRGQSLRSPDHLNFDQFRFRAGLAPYVADFESLHTWLIGEVLYEPSMQNQFTWAPLIRMFYRNVLWETGVSVRGEWLFNTIIHF